MPVFATLPLSLNGVPYQLAKLQPKHKQQGFMDSAPEDGSLSSFYLEAGDIIVCGTDGVWDNVSHHALAPLLARNLTGSDDGEELVKHLAYHVVFTAISFGRKPDDVTVVVARVP